MDNRTKVYFASDVHLGLRYKDPVEREMRFVEFLRGIPRDARALCLLGDIWDFWYEYHDVIPKTGARVVAELISLLDSGVEVYYTVGNHDVWIYSFFEELGIKKIVQPSFLEFGGKTFCLAHGDCIGKINPGYRLIIWLTTNRVCQFFFSLLHPRMAYVIARKYSEHNRKSHKESYVYIPEKEGTFKFAQEVLEKRKVDYFIFGHFHRSVNVPIGEGSRFIILDDWMEGGYPHVCFDGEKISIVS